MAEQKLNLIEFAARTPAEPGAGSPQIVWRERVNASLGRGGLHDVPNGLLAEPLAADPAKPTDLAKDFPVLNSSAEEPVGQLGLHPIGDWNRADVARLPDEVHDCPVLLPLLQVFSPQHDSLVSSQAAGQHESEQGSIAF